MVLHILHLLKGQENMGSDKIERDSFWAPTELTNEKHLRDLELQKQKRLMEELKNKRMETTGGHLDIPRKLASPQKSLRMRIFQEKINRNNSNERG